MDLFETLAEITKPTEKCKYCHKEFILMASLDYQDYCSDECRHFDVECWYCGKKEMFYNDKMDWYECFHCGCKTE